ncbi:MAG: Bcr/CflA family efflux MFS transporter [Leptothrix sp. (in: b-proteobacteria)]
MTSPAPQPASSDPAEPARFGPVGVAITLALLFGLQPVTTDLYLPGLPLLAHELGASLGSAQLTMSALMLAFGLGQLVWGPVADRIGRKPVLMTGLMLFALASAAGSLAASLHALVLARVLQGAALAAAVVVGRAMVRDLYPPSEGTHVMSLGMSGLGLIAISSPLAGGWITGALGWRANFACVFAISLLIAGWVALRVPETLAQPNPHALQPGPLWSAWGRIARHPGFRAWTMLTACTYGGLFVFLAGSSFIYMQVLGLSAATYGLVLSTGSVAYLIGTFVCRRWLVQVGPTGTVRRAAAFTLAGGLSMAALALAGVQAVWAVMLPQLAYAFAHGMHQSCGQAGAVAFFPREAGTASALAGFVLAATAFGVGNGLGPLLHTAGGTTGHEIGASSLAPFTLAIALAAVLTAFVALTQVQRHGSAPAHG